MSKVYITNICPICGKQEAHQYEKEQFDSWVNGKLIQEALFNSALKFDII